MNRYDIAIIGTGPAGLEAAITAKVRNKNIILFGNKNLSMKMNVVDHPILNYLGLPEIPGKEMADMFKKHLEKMQIEVDERKVTSVYSMGDYFSMQLNDNSMIESSSVIVASGVIVGKPYPGEEKFLGRGVSYCATCDAPLYKGKDVIVIAGSKEEEKEAEFLAELVNSIKYIPLYKDEINLNEKIEVIYEKPKELMGDNKVSHLITDKNKYQCDCVFILREAQFPSQLIPGVEIDGNAIKVNRNMETNINGLFAAGDITGQPYQYIKSAGEGNVAALSAVNYLAKK